MAFVEKKNILYVGGLDAAISEEMLHAAFIPFGEIKSIQMPKDFTSSIDSITYFVNVIVRWLHHNFFYFYYVGKAKGFGFVEFESEEDASDAIENMDGSELMGKVIRCNVAKAVTKLAPGKALWSSDEWAQEENADGAGQDEEKMAELKLIPEPNYPIDDDNDDDQ